MFRKALIANRGEIAVRIATTLQEMGVKVVAVYSEPDRSAPHVACADEAFGLEGETASDTYLRGDRILEIARTHGVDAIHPGYGFLSENAAFAEACRRAGVVFIGPTPEVIRSMGDKVTAKETMTAAGVPVVPGWTVPHDAPLNVIAKEATAVGYPLLVKAADGVGGRGMRLVHEPDKLEAALQAAAREAKSAFGDARVFLEKYISRPRHVEFQIFGDQHGHFVHLFERECSIQRRHQKIVEESPSPALSADLRARMGEAAVKAARTMGYTNAGTVEFILDESGGFYFLEVNTRLQVEHPVTEMTVHRDLVRAQIAVAAGEPLPFLQGDLRQDGHAIECRIYAEDPARNFLPSTGRLHRFVPPVGPSIRVDSGVRQGSAVTIHYDPMLAKLIVWGGSRDEALQKMSWALRHFVVIGVTTNIEFLQRLVQHPEFAAGRLHTHFLEQHRLTGEAGGQTPKEAFIIAALSNIQSAGRGRPVTGHGESDDGQSPWKTAGAWRAV